MNMKLTTECKIWAQNHLPANQYQELVRTVGQRASIASASHGVYGVHAGKDYNRKVRAAFGIPAGMPIYEPVNNE